MTVRLCSKQRENIDFQLWKFPGGELGVRLHDLEDVEDTGFEVVVDGLPTMDDLMVVAQLSDILDGDIDVYMPYLPYARQDRACHVGESHALHVFIRMLASIPMNTLKVADLHSEKSRTLLKICDVPFVEFTQEQVMDRLPQFDWLISPDKGASEKIYKHRQVRAGVPVLQCTKTRFPNGGMAVGLPEELKDALGSACILDDIFDGGSTFIHLAHEIKAVNKDLKLSLAITHGIFSNQAKLNECYEIFDTIYVYNLMNPLAKAYVKEI